eukprot:Skav219403  [mRNA]  locus=scaffold1139:59852:71300:+ [translate_table: standard]
MRQRDAEQRHSHRNRKGLGPVMTCLHDAEQAADELRAELRQDPVAVTDIGGSEAVKKDLAEKDVMDRSMKSIDEEVRVSYDGRLSAPGSQRALIRKDGEFREFFERKEDPEENEENEESEEGRFNEAKEESETSDEGATTESPEVPEPESDYVEDTVENTIAKAQSFDFDKIKEDSKRHVHYTAATSPTGTEIDADEKCPDACPLFAEDSASPQHCNFKCVSTSDCGLEHTYTNLAQPVPDKSRGFCRRCRVPGCHRCNRNSHDDVCAECLQGFALENGACVYSVPVIGTLLKGSLYLVIGFPILYFVAWYASLALRPKVNVEEERKGLQFRTQTKLCKPDFGERPEERQLWPLKTNTLAVPVAGPGSVLFFRYQLFIMLWALVIAVSEILESDVMALEGKDGSATESGRDAAVNSKKEITFRESKLHLKALVAEPMGICWENMAIPQSKKRERIWASIKTIFLASFAWSVLIYMPFAQYQSSFSYSQGDKPSLAMTLSLTVVVVIGNLVMYTTCADAAGKVGFMLRDSQEGTYMVASPGRTLYIRFGFEDTEVALCLGGAPSPNCSHVMTEEKSQSFYEDQRKAEIAAAAGDVEGRNNSAKSEQRQGNESKNCNRPWRRSKQLAPALPWIPMCLIEGLPWAASVGGCQYQEVRPNGGRCRADAEQMQIMQIAEGLGLAVAFVALALHFFSHGKGCHITLAQSHINGAGLETL